MTDTFTYWVFSAPDDVLDPTIWHNGQQVEAVSHHDAALKRFANVDPGSVSRSDFWVAGLRGGALKLVKFKVRPTGFKIEQGERS